MNNGSGGMRERLMKFMEGRYGADTLFYMMTGLYLGLIVINIPLQSWTIHIIGLVIFAVTVLRSLSRNIEKRKKENDWVVARIRKLRANSARSRQIKEQSGEYYFKKCPGCKKTLRLPRVQGQHNTTCPACGKSFTMNIKKGKAS